MPPDDLAIFDLDGTLFRGNTFHRWLQFLIFAQESGLNLLLRLKIGGWCALRAFKLLSHAGLKHRVMLAVVAPHGIDMFVDSWIEPGLSACCVAEARRLQGEGFRIVLATAAPDIYAVPFGQKFGFSKILASRLATDGALIENSGQRKLDCVLTELNVSSVAVVFSDHPDDLPLLVNAGRRFLVNPKTNSLVKITAVLGSGGFLILRDNTD